MYITQIFLISRRFSNLGREIYNLGEYSQFEYGWELGEQRNGYIYRLKLVNK